MDAPITAIAGHRGASGLVPHENTLHAIARTAQVGARWVEIDVRRTSDGALVLHHDAACRGRSVGALTLLELRALAAETGLAVPTLAEALDEARRRGLSVDVELKEPGTEDAVVAETRAILSPEHYFYSSFHDEVVSGVKQRDPAGRAALLLGRPTLGASLTARLAELYPLARLRACRADLAAPHWRLVQLGVLPRLAAAGYPAWVWTVNRPSCLRWLLDREVAGIITDFPDRAVALRAERAPPPAAPACPPADALAS
jgi:glycerophosphoryl diester phosphodiesterase